MMTRADIIQIIFGIETKEMDIMKDLSRSHCNDCLDCEHNEHNGHYEPYTDSLCPVFWTVALTEDEWTDCVRRFTILYNAYCLGHNRGYIEGEKHQHELESEDKNNDSN